jgi:hypothetical protein
MLLDFKGGLLWDCGRVFLPAEARMRKFLDFGGWGRENVGLGGSRGAHATPGGQDRRGTDRGPPRHLHSLRQHGGTDADVYYDTKGVLGAP